MSLFLNGKNIEMYAGDTGYITFIGMPTGTVYDMHFSALTSKRTLIFEMHENSRDAWLKSDNTEEPKKISETTGEIETDEEYNARCAADPTLTKKGVVTFFISDTYSNLLTVPTKEMTAVYLYGLKMCYTDEYGKAQEDTLLPPVSYNAMGKVVFGQPTLIIVYPKYSEGE